MPKQETPLEKQVAFLIQCAGNPDRKHRGNQHGTRITMTMLNKKSSSREYFLFQSARNRNYPQLTHLYRVFEMALNLKK
jgi:hypothetical protein